jgi:hypothetical protein
MNLYFILFFLFNYVLLLFYFRRKLPSNIIFIFLIYSFFTFLLTIYQSLFKNLPLGGIDWIYFHNSAILLLSPNHNLFSIFSANVELFIRIVALFYSFFSIDDRLVYFLNLLFSYFTIIYFFNLIFNILKIRISSRILFFFLFYPVFILHSVTFLRESLIIFFVVLIIISIFNIIKKFSILNLIFLLFISFLLLSLHSGFISIPIAFLTFFLIYKINFLKLSIFFFLLFILTLYLNQILEIVSIYIFKLGSFSSLPSLMDSVLDTFIYTDQGATTNYVFFIPKTFVELLIYIPYLFINFIFSPFPYQVVNFSTFLTMVFDFIPRFFIFIYFLYSVFYFPAIAIKLKKDKFFFIIGLILILSYLIFSIGTKSYGTAIRHRFKLFPIEFLFLIFFLKRKAFINEKVI